VRRYSAQIAKTAAAMVAGIANPKATVSLPPDALSALFAWRDGTGFGGVGVSETAEGLTGSHERTGTPCS
jgi:hypothetical protein